MGPSCKRPLTYFSNGYHVYVCLCTTQLSQSNASQLNNYSNFIHPHTYYILYRFYDHGFFFFFTKMELLSKKLQICRSRAKLTRLCYVSLKSCQHNTISATSTWSRVKLARLCPHHIFLILFLFLNKYIL